jgi:hypothetical protein
MVAILNLDIDRGRLLVKRFYVPFHVGEEFVETVSVSGDLSSEQSL